MKKVLFAGAISILTWVGASGLASAKVPTAKITVTGGQLTTTLEVMDPRALDFKVGPWGGGFLDMSKGIANPPPARERYEVSFYNRVPNGLRKFYVVYFCPGHGNQQGYVYTPGKGEKWYSLNVSTIIRGGQFEGKWRYASREWEALIKTFIASEEAAQRRGPGI